MNSSQIPEHRYPFFDIFYFAFFAIEIYIFSSLPTLNCDKRLDLWIIVIYSSCLLIRLYEKFIIYLNNSILFKLSLLINIFLKCPTVIYLTIQGTIWTYEERKSRM